MKAPPQGEVVAELDSLIADEFVTYLLEIV